MARSFPAALFALFFGIHSAAIAIPYLRNDFSWRGSSSGIAYYLFVIAEKFSVSPALLHITGIFFVFLGALVIFLSIKDKNLAVLFSVFWICNPLQLYGIYYASGIHYVAAPALVLLFIYFREGEKLFLAALSFTALAVALDNAALGLPFLVFYREFFRKKRNFRFIFILVAITAAIAFATHLSFTLKFSGAAFLGSFFWPFSNRIYWLIGAWRIVAILLFIFALTQKTHRVFLEEFGSALIITLAALPSLYGPLPYFTILTWVFLFRFIIRSTGIPVKRSHAAIFLGLIAVFTIFTAREFHRYYSNVAANYKSAALAILPKLSEKRMLENSSTNPWEKFHTELLRRAAVYYGANPEKLSSSSGKPLKIYFDEQSWQVND